MPAARKYRLKPEPVEAFQWKGNTADWPENWPARAFRPHETDPEKIYISAYRRGKQLVCPGDWVVRGPWGLTRYSNEEFLALYEPWEGE